MGRSPFEIALFSIVAIVIAFLVLYPVGMMVGGTFLTADGRLTSEHWVTALKLPILWEIVGNTLLVTILATLIAIVIGLALAFLVARTDMPLRPYFEYISIVPFLTPPIIAGFAWQILAERRSGVLNYLLAGIGVSWRLDVMSIGGVTLVSALYLIPFVFLIALGVLRSINPDLEEASVIAGASEIGTVARITLPLLLPAITSAALLAFMYSNILFGIHATLGMPVNIWFLTTAVYQSMSVVPAQINHAAILACLLMIMGAAATYVQIRLLADNKGYQTITGKGFRTRSIPLGAWRWPAFGLCVFYIFVVAILPYLILFLRSLKPFMFQPGMNWTDVLTGWQFDKYWSIFRGDDPTLTLSIWNSFILAFTGAVIGMALTTIAAYILAKTDIRARQILNFLCMVPLALPSVVLGIAILWGYNRAPLLLYGTIWILLVAYVTKDLPLGLKSVHSSFLQVHAELEESARVCGASWWRQFTTITAPLVKPGITIGFVLTFASILREVGASIILYSQGNEVVAYVLFNLWENGYFQSLSAFIMVTTFITIAVVAVILRVGRLKFADLTHARVEQS